MRAVSLVWCRGKAHSAHEEITGSSLTYEKEIAEAEEVVQEVCELYGPEIRRPYEWARPLLPDKVGRITFADLDRSVTNNQLRLIYSRGNHGIHAGSLMTLKSIDMQKSYLNSTRPSGEIEDFGPLMSGAATLMGLVASVTTCQIAAECRMLDEAFAVAIVSEAKSRVREALSRDMGRRDCSSALPKNSEGSEGSTAKPRLPRQRP